MSEATARKTAELAVATIVRAAPGPIFVASGLTALAAKPGVMATIDGQTVDIGGKSVQMPALEIGRNYFVMLNVSDELVADIADVEPFGGVLGGFHYAPGGNATARAGGDDVPAINPLSIWDVGFRPACADPRGMAYVAGAPGGEGLKPFWADIYLLGVDHLANGTSTFGVEIADGYKHTPKLDDGTRLKKLDYAQARGILLFHGKDMMSFAEFSAAAYGVTERTTPDSRPNVTGLDAARSSRAGLMQATGNLYVWGHDGDPDSPRASLFGGSWDSGGFAGSRCADVGLWPGSSHEWLGARGRSDHLQLD